MTVPASPNPVTLMALSAIAYDDMHTIHTQVQELNLGLRVVWGPAERRHEADPVPYSAAFIASDGHGAYTVVIRGTEAESLSSWTGEDFDVRPPLQPFSPFAANAGDNAMISQGTFNGLNDLLSLEDSTGQKMVAFLMEASPAVLYVTGHSLGGTLTPPLFAYLNYQLYGGVYTDSMAPCSFAGLTAGNDEFNSYFNGLFSSGLTWRFYNTLDFAPLCWWSQAEVEAIYQPHLQYGGIEADLLNPLFAAAADVGYAQPAGGSHALVGSYNAEHTTWPTQAMSQHHHTTYRALVGEAFPAALPIKGILQPQAALQA